MTKASEPSEPLVLAAMALVGEMSLYGKLADEVGRVVVNSEKSLARAARVVQEAAACHQRIMQHVSELSAAMTTTREKQESDLARMAESARNVSKRADKFQGLVARYRTLAESSKSMNAQASDIAARRSAGGTDDEVLHALGELGARANETIEQAEQLVDAARADEFEDLARSADTLKHQMQGARNRITLAARSLAERAPS